MKLTTDDPIHQIDNVWLGVPGYTFPFRVRYSAVVVGFMVAIVIFIFEHRLGIRSLPNLLAFLLAGTIGITTALMRTVNFDRPLRCLPVIFWHEVTAPRTPKRIEAASVLPKGLR